MKLNALQDELTGLRQNVTIMKQDLNAGKVCVCVYVRVPIAYKQIKKNTVCIKSCHEDRQIEDLQ